MSQQFDRQDPGWSPVTPTIDRQPRSTFRKKQAPIGRLAEDWGERIEVRKTVARGGKPTEPADGPSELEKQGAVYETLNRLGGNADWREIARYIQSRWGFVLTEAEITALRARWVSLEDTMMAAPQSRAPQATDSRQVDTPSEVHHSPDR